MVLSLVLAYRALLPTWTISWYGLVDQWGFTLVALTWWLMLAATAAGAMFLLGRREVLKTLNSR